MKWPGEVVRLRRRGRRCGWGIWHILYIKDHFFINSRGLKPEKGVRQGVTLTTDYNAITTSRSICFVIRMSVGVFSEEADLIREDKRYDVERYIYVL